MSKFLSGQWNAICDRCGLEFKSGKLRKDWQGLMVDAKCYEQRHPQDLLRVRPERAVPPWTRPYSEAFLPFEVFQDLFTFLPDTTTGQDYIDPTYFLEDYIGSRIQITVQFVRNVPDTLLFSDTLLVFENQKSISETIPFPETVSIETLFERSFTESPSLLDSGHIINFNYIDSTYFAEDYVGEYTLF